MDIRNIVIAGGTHGNEYTGVYLIKKLEQAGFQEKYPDLSIDFMLGNPKAYEQGVRFIDFDLNRSFLPQELEDLSMEGYEANRAKAINHHYGPQSANKTDFMIDVHTTTSNMGVTLIPNYDNPYNFQLLSYLKEEMDDVSIFYSSPESFTGEVENPFMFSIAPYGFVLEIGPTANGLVRHDLLEKAEQAIVKALEFVEAKKRSEDFSTASQVEYYDNIGPVYYPTDKDGAISAVVHKDLQDRDFQLLNEGDPIFAHFSGETICHEGVPAYPIFINEAAYYYKRVAFTMAQKKTKHF